MWSQYDRQQLPTPHEVIEVRKGIASVEEKLEAALALVNRLRWELEEHRAWLAPVRRLNRDVMGTIFEACGEDDWRVCLDIGNVCRLWREIVLETPGAWHSIGKRRKDEHLDLVEGIPFLRRSGHLSLHLHFSPDKAGSLPIDILRRTTCLRHDSPSYLRRKPATTGPEVVWPSVSTLSIQALDVHGGVPLWHINTTRFPSLTALYLTTRLNADMDRPPTEQLSTFPRLQHLRIATDWLDVYRNVIRLCTETLLSLTVAIGLGDLPTSNVEIKLPRLCALNLDMEHDSEGLGIIFVTPVLTAYSGPNASTFIAYEGPISNVVRGVERNRLSSLRSYGVPHLQDTPNLTYLCIADIDGHSAAAIKRLERELRQEPEVCPNLREVFFCNWRQFSLESTLQVNGRLVRLKSHNDCQTQGPFSITCKDMCPTSKFAMSQQR